MGCAKEGEKIRKKRRGGMWSRRVSIIWLPLISLDYTGSLSVARHLFLRPVHSRFIKLKTMPSPFSATTPSEVHFASRRTDSRTATKRGEKHSDHRHLACAKQTRFYGAQNDDRVTLLFLQVADAASPVTALECFSFVMLFFITRGAQKLRE